MEESQLTENWSLRQILILRVVVTKALRGKQEQKKNAEIHLQTLTCSPSWVYEKQGLVWQGSFSKLNFLNFPLKCWHIKKKRQRLPVSEPFFQLTFFSCWKTAGRKNILWEKHDFLFVFFHWKQVKKNFFPALCRFCNTYIGHERVTGPTVPRSN